MAVVGTITNSLSRNKKLKAGFEPSTSAQSLKLICSDDDPD